MTWMKHDWNAVNNELSDSVVERGLLGDLLAQLGCERVKSYRGGSSFRMPCPIHHGEHDNLNIKEGGGVLPILWACNSEHCERRWVPSLLGFVRAVLSDGRLKPVHPAVAAEYVRRFLAGRPAAVRRPRAGRAAKPKARRLNLPRERVRARLELPSPYFVGRGFSPAVLDRLDVGYSPRRRKSVVPLHSDDGRAVVGYLERSHLPYCSQCRKCHGPAAPCRSGEPKWQVMTGFAKGDHLYNYHAAALSPSRVVLVVEGPCDVWRAEEAGRLAVALLGVDITAMQLRKLSALNKAVLLALDNDKTGRDAMHRVQECLRGKVPFVMPQFVPPKYHDLGEMPVQEAAGWLSSVISPDWNVPPRKLNKISNEAQTSWSGRPRRV